MIKELPQTIKNELSKLSQESQGAISSVNWQLISEEIGKKYILEEEIEDLQTEIALVLMGLEYPEFLPQNIKDNIGVSQDDANKMTNEILEKIFTPIVEKLESNTGPLGKNEQKNNTSSELDPRFTSLPMETQVAISKSNYQKNIYIIGEKYKLNIEQMGILEDITVQVILNIIHGDKYEEILASKVTIGKEDIANLVKDINETVFKKIRSLEMEEGGGTIKNEELGIKNENTTTTKTEEEVPLPPYGKTIKNEEEGKIKNYELGMKNGNREGEIKNEGVPKNMMAEKLKGVTLSDHSVSDYSTPKISSGETEGRPKSPDPYREAF